MNQNYAHFRGKICCLVIEGMGLVIGKVEEHELDKKSSVTVLKNPRAVQIKMVERQLPPVEPPEFGEQRMRMQPPAEPVLMLPELIGSPTEITLLRSAVIGYVVTDEYTKKVYTSVTEAPKEEKKKSLLEVVK